MHQDGTYSFGEAKSVTMPGGVGDPSWLWTGDRWEQIGDHPEGWLNCDEKNEEEASDEESIDETLDLRPGRTPAWHLQTRDGYCIEASPTQRFVARFDDMEAWAPLHCLGPGDDIALASCVAREEEVSAATQQQADEAYVLGVLAGCRRLTAIDPLRLAQADPEIRDVVERWAQQACVPYPHSAPPYEATRDSKRTTREMLLQVAGANHPDEAMVPGWVMGANHAVMRAYLRGIIDRWAVPDRDGTVVIPLPNETIRRQIQLLLLMPFGIVSAKRADVRRTYPLEIRPGFTRKMLRIVGFSVQRKTDQVNDWTDGFREANEAMITWQPIVGTWCTGKKRLASIGKDERRVYVAMGFVTSEPSNGVEGRC